MRPLPTIIKASLHLAAIATLTLLTQVGGVCYAIGLVAGLVRGRVIGLAIGLGMYGLITLVLLPAASPLWGREPLPCALLQRKAILGPQSLLYCALNRHYATPSAVAATWRIAQTVERRHPGTTVTYLDAGFPLPLGLPLLPHLSHRNGRAVDLALFYEGRPRGGAWPVGYFAFAPSGQSATAACARTGAMRWSLPWLQPLFADIILDRDRTAELVRAAAAEPSVSKVLFHPELARALGVGGQKVRFAGCYAARHDDHVHLEVGGR